MLRETSTEMRVTMKIKLFSKADPNVSFWKWFSSRKSEIYENFENDKECFLDEISNRLKVIDDNLTFEISTIKEGEKREFIISADGIADSFETVESLCNVAPHYSNWTIIKFRPRMNSESLQISMGDIQLSYDDIFFTYENKGHYIDLSIHIEKYDPNDNRYTFAYFILLDSLIGEYDAVSKIGNTQFFTITDHEQDKCRRFYELIDIIDELP